MFLVIYLTFLTAKTRVYKPEELFCGDNIYYFVLFKIFYKKSTIMLYCQSGNRSEEASKILKTLGYKKVINLGGLIEAQQLLGEEIVKS